MDASVPLVDLGASEGRWAPAGAETHISVLLFAGARAYKLCKPVNLGFVDYSTRPRRRAALVRELDQNRRFAPDVYLGLLDLVDEHGVVHDHALVMRRMPEERRLSRLLHTEEAVDRLREVAKRVAAVHAAAPRTALAAEAASPAAVRRNWEDNEAAMRPFAGWILDEQVLDEVGVRFRRYLAGRARLLERRIAQGLAVDGHGDLLADDIFCLEDGPRILDCLAFDDRLRSGDVLADTAFLAMDVERRAGAPLAQRFLDLYGEFSDEHHPASLADHYVAYRAQVRAKVACLRAEQDGSADARTAANALLELCRDHLDRSRVRLVLVGGTPGTGKSTVAEQLAQVAGRTVLRSDEVRKELAGLRPDADAAAAPGAGIYGPAETEATYTELLRRAAVLAERGETVVLDASWVDRRHRVAARDVAARVAADVVELHLDAPLDVVTARIAARRSAGTDPSDATEEVAVHLRRRLDPWPEAVRIDTTGPLPACVSLAEAAL